MMSPQGVCQPAGEAGPQRIPYGWKLLSLRLFGQLLDVLEHCTGDYLSGLRFESLLWLAEQSKPGKDFQKRAARWNSHHGVANQDDAATVNFNPSERA